MILKFELIICLGHANVSGAYVFQPLTSTAEPISSSKTLCVFLFTYFLKLV